MACQLARWATSKVELRGLPTIVSISPRFCGCMREWIPLRFVFLFLRFFMFCFRLSVVFNENELKKKKIEARLALLEW